MYNHLPSGKVDYVVVIEDDVLSPFAEFDRTDWSRLAAATALPLTEEDVENLAGLGDPIDLVEVDTVYRPLSRLLNLYVAASQGLRQATSTFLGDWSRHTPFVIGVAGSVAVGKSTVSRQIGRASCRERRENA